jgi:predicted nucleic acid-binding protein
MDYRVRRASLDPGERDAIRLALETDARLLLIDDRPGRRLAQTLGVPITGTVGILLLTKKAGLLPTVRQSLDRLMVAGFYMDRELMAHAVRAAGEEPVATEDRGR